MISHQVVVEEKHEDYMTGDLISCPQDESVARCISEDCPMSAGIAVMFKKKFGRVSELKEQKKLPGQCAVLSYRPSFIYYHKEKNSHKPTYVSLRQSLEDMKYHCLQNAVNRVSIPQIGCGLDRLQWSKVSKILEQVFKDTNITITVYSLPLKERIHILVSFHAPIHLTDFH
uniref:O-acyl-ADP-ribose deacylase 1 n=1 Tax=Poecilia latipinna TaxID=48699 RepID=A0A3B3VS55_9TELE